MNSLAASRLVHKLGVSGVAAVMERNSDPTLAFGAIDCGYASQPPLPPRLGRPVAATAKGEEEARQLPSPRSAQCLRWVNGDVAQRSSRKQQQEAEGSSSRQQRWSSSSFR